MAKVQKICQSTKSQSLKITHPDTAGIDIGKDLMQVSVPSDRSEDSNRAYATFTSDLRDLTEWLVSCGIKRVVMESTGIYWISIFLMLQEKGFETILVNAKDVKNMAGRKTDVSDADWLRFLGSCNLIKPCYQVDAVSRRLRSYSRLRNTKIKDLGREIQHMKKAMESMNIKLAGVISDIAGVGGTKIIKAILSGKRDPMELAALADKCKSDRETIAKSLEGTWDTEHMFALRQARETYEFLQGQIEQIDNEMAVFLDSYEISGVAVLPEDKRSGKAVSKKNEIQMDVEQYAYGMFGVNLMRIGGVSKGTLLVLMSELGPDFCEKFLTPKKFSRWCNLAPEDKVTGGRLQSSKVPKRPNPVGQALRQAAVSVQRKDCPLGHYYRRMRSRLGPAQAVVATAHKMAEIIYLCVSRGVEYNPSVAISDENEILQKKIERTEKALLKLKNLKSQLNEN